jgi:hypothetical protein
MKIEITYTPHPAQSKRRYQESSSKTSSMAMRSLVVLKGEMVKRFMDQGSSPPTTLTTAA